MVISLGIYPTFSGPNPFISHVSACSSSCICNNARWPSLSWHPTAAPLALGPQQWRRSANMKDSGVRGKPGCQGQVDVVWPQKSSMFFFWLRLDNCKWWNKCIFKCSRLLYLYLYIHPEFPANFWQHMLWGLTPWGFQVEAWAKEPFSPWDFDWRMLFAGCETQTELSQLEGLGS